MVPEGNSLVSASRVRRPIKAAWFTFIPLFDSPKLSTARCLSGFVRAADRIMLLPVIAMVSAEPSAESFVSGRSATRIPDSGLGPVNEQTKTRTKETYEYIGT